EVYLDKTESGLDKNSVVLLNQIRSIDKQRLHKKLGKADKNTIKDIDKALQVSLGLIDL
ncbi:MAG: type II toxin-antitoxin system PemK/MazF family toxin, partial [Candidatus Magasanikbacteria bacterium]